MDLTCWVCRQEPMPEGEGMERFGLCPLHLQARINELMRLKGEPAIEVLRG